MGIGDALRLFFLGFYAVVIAVTLIRVLPTVGTLRSAEQSATGARRFLPAVLLPFGFLLPPAVLFLRAGEIDATWTAVRMLGLGLGLYAAVILPWAAATLGRFLVPRAVCSGDLALWLGTALGTLNALLLVLLPLYLLGLSAEAAVEERLLEGKFGQAYRDYAARVGRFAPRPGT